jgi:ferritin
MFARPDSFERRELSMPGTRISTAVVGELQRQLNHEYAAAHAYTALAMWCADRNLKGFARYFHKQSGEEREHAQRIADHLLDRQVRPDLSAVPSPQTEFAGALEVAKHARAMEQANTKGVHKAYQAATKAGDAAAQVMLQWFVTEQVEEEAWCEEMVDRVEVSSSPAALMALDRHIERYLSEKSHEGGGEE